MTLPQSAKPTEKTPEEAGIRPPSQISLDPVPLHRGSSADTPTAELTDGPLTVKRSILPGGIRVITEEVPGTRAASLGFWVRAGSRDEGRAQAGASHFLEHLLFKGTSSRSALQIAEAFDSVGGDSNAATSKETTHYWAKVLDSDAAMALETLTDMVTSSMLRDEDVETERGVILDELAMVEDSPPEVAHEAFSAALFGEAPLGRPVGGTTESVRAISADQIRDLYRTQYQSGNLVVAAAGSVDHDEVAEALVEALGRTDWDRDPQAPSWARAETGGAGPAAFEQKTVRRDVEQAHLLVGSSWLEAANDARATSNVLLTILGGGMSSRLFQEVREKRGLAYSTYAFDVAYSDTGYFALYAGCAPENLAEVEKIMWGEAEKLAAGEFSERELERAKGQLRGALALGLEDSGARMARLARAEIMGRFLSVDAALGRLEAVQKADVTDLAARMVEGPRARGIVTGKDR